MFTFIKKFKIEKQNDNLAFKKLMKFKRIDFLYQIRSNKIVSQLEQVNWVSSKKTIEIIRKRLSKKSYRAQLFLQIRQFYKAYLHLIHSQTFYRVYSTKHLFKRLRNFRKKIRANSFVFNIFFCILYFQKHNYYSIFPSFLFETLPSYLFLKTKLRDFYLNIFKPIFLNTFSKEFTKLIKKLSYYVSIYGKLNLRSELKQNEFAYKKKAKYCYIKQIFGKHIRKYLSRQNKNVIYKREKPLFLHKIKLINSKNFLRLKKPLSMRILISPLPFFLFPLKQKNEQFSRFFRTHLFSKLNFKFNFIYRNFTNGLFFKRITRKQKKITVQVYNKSYNSRVKKLAHLLNFFMKSYGQQSFYKLSQFYKIILPYLTINKLFWVRKCVFLPRFKKLSLKFIEYIQIKNVVVFIHLFWFFYKLLTLVDLQFLVQNFKNKILLTFFFERMYSYFNYIYISFLINLRNYNYKTGNIPFYYIFPAKVKFNLWRIPKKLRYFSRWNKSHELHQILFTANPILTYVLPLYKKFAKRVSTYVLSPYVFRFQYRNFKLDFIRKFKNINIGYTKFEEKMQFEKKIYNLLRWYLRLIAWKIFNRKIYNKVGKKIFSLNFEQVLTMQLQQILPFKLKSFLKTRMTRFMKNFVSNFSKKSNRLQFSFIYHVNYNFPIISNRQTLSNFTPYLISNYKEINYRIKHLTFLHTVRTTIQPSFKFTWNRTFPNFMLMYICKHN
jgi:hypothetical protein